MTYVLNNYDKLDEKPLACNPKDQATSCLFGYTIPCETKYGRDMCWKSFKCEKSEVMSCEVHTWEYPDVQPVPLPSGLELLGGVLFCFIFVRAIAFCLRIR